MSSNQMASMPAWRVAASVFALTLMAGLVFIGVAQAANQIDASAPRTAAADLSLIGETRDLLKGSTDPSGESVASISRTRPRLFFMPFPVAKNQSMTFARYFYNNTSPYEFTDEVESSSYWDFYDTGLCKRNSSSRMTCFSYVSADFEIINYYDEVIGEDTFVCAWDTAVWYPYARKKTLKWTTMNPACFWESET